MKRLLLLLCISILTIPFSVSAQDSKLGNWLVYSGNKKVKEKWNWAHEVQYRNYNAIGDLEQLLLRTGIGYNLSENNNNVLIGYGYILSENYIGESNEKISINEHRIYQQFITRQDLNLVKLQHRYRFEQRWVEEDFKVRFRYALSMKIPLNNKDLEDNTFYLSAYNEIFIATKENIFDRNRLYGGLGYKLNKSFRFEVGYMNQFFSNGGRDQINLITSINF